MPLDLASEIGQRIVSVRNKLKLSQSAFGSRAGLSQNVTSSIERGAGGATIENLVAIMTTHDINPIWLLLGTGPMFLGEAIQPRVVESLGKTIELLATDSPALQALAKDEELTNLGEISFEEMQYLSQFMKNHAMLNKFGSVDAVINILEAYRKYKLQQMSAVRELIRERANRQSKED